MILLILGIVLWWAAHLFKRTLPELRSAMGERGKGVVALALFASVALMILGYRGMEFIPIYDPPSWTRHLNNLLMFAAVGLFGLGSSKSPLRGKLRHPMLLGMLVWAVSHLLVNGDLAAVLLFGTMAIWAVVEIFVINAKEPEYVPWDGGSNAGTIRLIVISVVVYAVIAGIHTWLGYWPFPG